MTLAVCRPCHVGNDIVDLAGRETLPRSRFVERICTPSELGQLASSEAWLFWAMFAAKEAAFKALKKRFPSLPFVPRSFVVGARLDSVEHGQERLELEVALTRHWVHALARTRRANVVWRVTRLCAGETESAAARRLLCQALAADERYLPSELSVVRDVDSNGWDGRGPPRIHVRGALAPIDASLSHDGRFAACAFGAEHA